MHCVTLLLLREEVEEAVCSLKAAKSPGVDNIPSELLMNGSEATTIILTAIFQKIWEAKEWPKERTHPLVVLYQRNATSSNVGTIVPSA